VHAAEVSNDQDAPASNVVAQAELAIAVTICACFRLVYHTSLAMSSDVQDGRDICTKCVADVPNDNPACCACRIAALVNVVASIGLLLQTAHICTTLQGPPRARAKAADVAVAATAQQPKQQRGKRAQQQQGKDAEPGDGQVRPLCSCRNTAICCLGHALTVLGSRRQNTSVHHKRACRWLHRHG
jgi:hypothetical protein